MYPCMYSIYECMYYVCITDHMTYSFNTPKFYVINTKLMHFLNDRFAYMHDVIAVRSPTAAIVIGSNN